jgi:uncharacterized protein (TIGR00299 family) protein
MTVAALLDLGADQQVLLEGLKSLKVEGYQIVIGRKEKNSISACDFDVILDEGVEDQHSHDHSDNFENDHGHNHGHGHDQDHDHSHDHNHSHNHTQGEDHNVGQIHSHNKDYSHSHSHAISNAKITRGKTIINAHTPIQYGHHDHRNLSIINEIIDGSSISDRAKSIAKRIFYIVAAAESKAHGKPIDEVHFHEVGAIDSIVDIVAAAICIDNLNIKEVIVSELYEGTGFITCQHGLLPIPVPAVSNIAAEHQLPLHITNVKGELVTPTGAAIVAALRTKTSLPREMKILKIGLGAGKRSYQGASGLLRAMLIEDTASRNANTIADRVWVLEANIDDCPGEALAYTMELLLKQGAKDAYYTPIYMKKNRPAYMLGVICDEDKLELLEEIIFTHTTTIGIRRTEARRTMLRREQQSVRTPYGEAIVKVCNFKDQFYYYPEYESVKKLSEASGIDYLSMYHEVQTIASQRLK